MATAAASRCTRRCGKKAIEGGRCEDHQRKPWENTSKRNTVLNKHQWNKAKQAHKELEPGCRVCGETEGVEVDHITEVEDGGALYDDSNLQTLCGPHHKQKTLLARRLRRGKVQT